MEVNSSNLLQLSFGPVIVDDENVKWDQVFVNNTQMTVQSAIQSVASAIDQIKSKTSLSFLWLRPFSTGMPPSEETFFTDICDLLIARKNVLDVGKFVLLHQRPNICSKVAEFIQVYSSNLLELRLSNCYWFDCQNIWESIGLCKNLKILDAKCYGFLAPDNINDIIAKSLNGKPLEELSFLIKHTHSEQMFVMFSSFPPGTLLSLEMKCFGNSELGCSFIGFGQFLLNSPKTFSALKKLRLESSESQEKFYDRLLDSLLDVCPVLTDILLLGPSVHKDHVFNMAVNYFSKNHPLANRLQVALNVRRPKDSFDTFALEEELCDVDADVLFDVSFCKQMQHELSFCKLEALDPPVHNEISLDCCCLLASEISMPTDSDGKELNRVFRVKCEKKTMIIGFFDWPPPDDHYVSIYD